jgi:3'(2'), 5'-bisphosphate nucleotidase
MSLSEPRLQAAIRAVTDACAITRHVQAGSQDIASMSKDDRSPVTVADFAAQALIAKRLRETLGEIVMVGEEDSAALRGAESSLRHAVVEALRPAWEGLREDDVYDAIDAGSHDASADAFWTLDPIDGTKGFLRGGQYAVSLAYIERGQVVIAVLGCPNLSADLQRPFDDPDPHGLVCYAAAGQGSWAVPADRTGAAPVPLHASAVIPDSIRLCESVESAHAKHDFNASLVDYLGGRGAPARLDSQAKYAVVARGQADAYVRIPSRAGYVEKIWDHAPGLLLATEAGAIVTDSNGDALDFTAGRELSRNHGIVCAAAPLHPRIINAIRDLRKA